MVVTRVDEANYGQALLNHLGMRMCSLRHAKFFETGNTTTVFKIHLSKFDYLADKG